MVTEAQCRCEVCGQRVDRKDVAPWVCFQSLWIFPGSARKAVSVERSTGQVFVSVHMHCLNLLIEGEMAGQRKGKAK